MAAGGVLLSSGLNTDKNWTVAQNKDKQIFWKCWKKYLQLHNLLGCSKEQSNCFFFTQHAILQWRAKMFMM